MSCLPQHPPELIKSVLPAVHDAISRLAELGTSTRPEMTGGFIIYGAGLIGYGLALRRRLPGKAWAMAVGTGVATFGVAAFPLGTPLSGTIHAAFAAVGYATLAALPIMASKALVSSGHGGLGRLSVLTGAATEGLSSSRIAFSSPNTR